MYYYRNIDTDEVFKRTTPLYHQYRTLYSKDEAGMLYMDNVEQITKESYDESKN